MTKHRIAVLLAATALVTLTARAQTAGELLQKGIYTQDTAGDLDDAIAVYRQIVNSGNSPRDIAAQAQYRLAQSLLQKGDLANGATEFSNLARNYADYGKLVASLAAEAERNVFSAQRGVQERRLADLIKFEQSRLQGIADSGSDRGNPQAKAVLDQALNSVDRGAYEAARLTLNSLINSYPASDYGRRAKLAIADSWLREGGAHGLAQAEAEINDFIRFYPNAGPAAPGGGRGGRGGGDTAANDAERIEKMMEALDRLKAAAARQQANDQARAETDMLQADLESAIRARKLDMPALNFDSNSPVAVKGVVFKFQLMNPNSLISVDPMDGTGKRYTFLLGSASQTSKQGLTRNAARLGDEVTVTGSLATGGQMMPDGTVAAVATTITAANGEKIYDRGQVPQ